MLMFWLQQASDYTEVMEWWIASRCYRRKSRERPSAHHPTHAARGRRRDARAWSIAGTRCATKDDTMQDELIVWAWSTDGEHTPGAGRHVISICRWKWCLKRRCGRAKSITGDIQVPQEGGSEMVCLAAMGRDMMLIGSSRSVAETSPRGWSPGHGGWTTRRCPLHQEASHHDCALAPPLSSYGLSVVAVLTQLGRGGFGRHRWVEREWFG